MPLPLLSRKSVQSGTPASPESRTPLLLASVNLTPKIAAWPTDRSKVRCVLRPRQSSAATGPVESGDGNVGDAGEARRRRQRELVAHDLHGDIRGVAGGGEEDRVARRRGPWRKCSTTTAVPVAVAAAAIGWITGTGRDRN